jgi:hypothetical protein
MPRRPTLSILLLAMWLSVFGVAQAQDDAPERPRKDDVQKAVDDVFSEPSFARGLDTTHLTIDELLELAGRYINEVLRSISNWLASLYVESPVLWFVVVATMIVVGLVLTYHMAWTFTRAFRGASEGEEGDVESERDARVRRYRDLRADALNQAQGGEARSATRTLLLALLALLAEDNVLTVAQSWTPREIVAALSTLAEFGPELAAFGAAVEGANYADHALTRADFDVCERALDELVPSVHALRRSESPA